MMLRETEIQTSLLITINDHKATKKKKKNTDKRLLLDCSPSGGGGGGGRCHIKTLDFQLTGTLSAVSIYVYVYIYNYTHIIICSCILIFVCLFGHKQKSGKTEAEC